MIPPTAPVFLISRDQVMAFDYTINGRSKSGYVEILLNKYRRTKPSNIKEAAVAAASAVQHLEDKNPAFVFQNFKSHQQ